MILAIYKTDTKRRHKQHVNRNCIITAPSQTFDQRPKSIKRVDSHQLKLALLRVPWKIYQWNSFLHNSRGYILLCNRARICESHQARRWNHSSVIITRRPLLDGERDLSVLFIKACTSCTKMMLASKTFFFGQHRDDIRFAFFCSCIKNSKHIMQSFGNIYFEIWILSFL